MPSAWYQPTPAHQEIRKTAPVPVVLQEAVPAPEQQPYPGPKVCLPGRAEAPKQPEPVPEEIDSPEDKPVIVPAMIERKPKKDSLSRHVSLQCCVSLSMMALFLLLRAVSEPAFLEAQVVMREAMADLTTVAEVSAWLSETEEQGMQETLREMLSVGIEEPADVRSVHSESISAMGGMLNPVSTEPELWRIPQTAAAAGGRYAVSMEKDHYALSVIGGYDTGTVCPVEGTLTSGYGPREHPITGKADFHTGIDIAAAAGTPILAAASGIVEQCGESASLGNYLILRHNKDTVTTYSHCLELLVQEGDAVDRGETIALVGSTGVSTGAHLHFECIVDGTLTDPSWIIGG